jgi:hypothetical protein
LGFRQKSRGIKVRRFEVVGILLGALTVLAGFGWHSVGPRAGWVLTPARVTGVSTRSHTESAASPEGKAPVLNLNFEYMVAGRVYRGQTRFDRVTRILYGALPEEMHAVLRARGILEFSDLPPEVRELLHERGIVSFDAIPVALLRAMEAQGYAAVSDVPEEARALVRQGQYLEAAEALGFDDAAVAALIADSTVVRASGRRGADRIQAASVLAGSVRVAGNAPVRAPVAREKVLHVRVDPARPERHQIVRFPYLEALSNHTIFLATALITILYCGVLYPRLKQTG